MQQLSSARQVLQWTPPVVLVLGCGLYLKLQSGGELSETNVARAQATLDRLSPPANSANQQHLNNLNATGVTVARNVLASSQTQEWVSRVRELKSRPDAATNDDRGRKHFWLTKKSFNKYRTELARLGGEDDGMKNRRSKSIKDDVCVLGKMAHNYFTAHGVTNYKLTQLQLLTAEPGSTHQIWHRDNVAPGLTAIVALRDVTTNGPTELLLCTHKKENTIFDFISNNLSVLPELEGSQSLTQRDAYRPLLATLNAGDAIFYDSRILHRGRGFGSTAPTGSNDDDTSRPVLVLRWDALITPPPGTSMVGTFLNGRQGILLSTILYIKNLWDVE
jgi:ectoine hydroxylase-related dioxygenase (phytanoyl-CoA dioxygenase family)